MPMTAMPNSLRDVVLEEEYLEEDWVFAYGSLIWNPEISYEKAIIGRVFGFHRDFCIRSTKYRGTPTDPGVVLGLDRGGSCVGVAYQLKPSNKRQSLEQLYRREMLNSIYRPTRVRVYLENQCDDQISEVTALTFVANRQSNAYLELEEEDLISRIAQCVGERGPNIDYALNTWQALKSRGVKDERLERLAEKLTQKP